MITELFSMLSSLDTDKSSGKPLRFNVNLNRNRIRSISAYSSNSIFYFQTIVSDQVTPEEMGMVSRALEKSYASFVVTCISLMPFHRIRADDQASIEEYLSQFHQNLGIKAGNSTAAAKMLDLVSTLEESNVDLANIPPEDLAQTRDFLLECWEKSRSNCTDFIKIVQETVSLNDMYTVDPIDPVTRVLQEQYMAKMEELDTWGFIGEATEDVLDDLFDVDFDDEEYDYDDDEDDDIEDEYSDEDIFDESSRKGTGKLSSSPLLKPLPKFVTFGETKIAPRHRHYNGKKRLDSDTGDNDSLDAAFDDISDAVADLDGTIDLAENARGRIMDEGNVKSAIDSIMFSLESVSDNKIKSCSSLTKLRSYEAKLKKLKNKYAKYLTRYKRKYQENKKNGTEKKLSIRFNGANISNPKAFMKQYGEYIKIINRRLKLVDKRRAELRKRKGLPTGEKDKKLEEAGIPVLSDLDLQTIDHCIEAIDEALNAPDSEIFVLDEAKERYDQAGMFKRMSGYAAGSGSIPHAVDNPSGGASPGDTVSMSAFTTQVGYTNAQRNRADTAEKERDTAISQRDVAFRGWSNTSKQLATTQQQLATSQENEKKSQGKIQSLGAELSRSKRKHRNSEKHNKEQAGIIRDQKKEMEGLRGQISKLERERSSNMPNDPRYWNNPNQSPGGGPPDDHFYDDMLVYDKARPANGVNVGRAAIRNGYTGHQTFDKEIFTDMDMRKSNEAVPTFAKATIGFVIDETEQVVNRDVLVGVKVYLHKVAAMDLINDIYNCIINKRKFLKFVKFISGEEKSLADLLFGFKELKTDALNTRGAGQWASAFRRRKRWAKMSIPYLTKNYTPNGTIVLTMNEVQYIKDEYGIDIMRPDHVKMLMDASFLLGFVVLDQANEMCYISYDGHEGQFQQYTYAMLERETNDPTSRAYREMFRAMAR